MTEEPYRWLEAIQNRREYVRDQLMPGSPVFVVSLPAGILFVGVGSGQSKVFEVFDRQAIAALGHPADIENVRQALIDAAHVESFTRSSQDVSLARLIGLGLSMEMKSRFEQIYSAPMLVELAAGEVGPDPQGDHLIRLRFDGSHDVGQRVVSVLGRWELEAKANEWISRELSGSANVEEALPVLMRAWWLGVNGELFDDPGASDASALDRSWKAALNGRVIEAALLDRGSHDAGYSRFQRLDGRRWLGDRDSSAEPTA